MPRQVRDNWWEGWTGVQLRVALQVVGVALPIEQIATWNHHERAQVALWVFEQHAARLHPTHAQVNMLAIPGVLLKASA